METVEQYIGSLDKDKAKIAKELQKLIKGCSKKLEEQIAYKMPAYKYKDKPVCYFMIFKSHIGFYPTVSPLVEFANEIKEYKHAKGSIQFKLDKPIPTMLIKKMIKFRMEEIEKDNKL